MSRDPNAVLADVSRKWDVASVAEQALAWRGRIDIVCPNAAIFDASPIAEMTEELWDRVIAINPKGVFLTVQACLPTMVRQRHGRVVVTSSITGPRTAIAGMAHYAARKAGINGFIRAAALEFAPLGITINGIEPGHVMTEGAAPGYDKGFLKAVEAFIPLGHLAEPDDIAEIDFLNGIIVRRGAELGIPVPANRAVYAMVKFVEGRMQLPAVDSHSR